MTKSLKKSTPKSTKKKVNLHKKRSKQNKIFTQNSTKKNDSHSFWERQPRNEHFFCVTLCVCMYL